MNRRHFLLSSLATGAALGAGGYSSNSLAQSITPLQNRMLVNLMLEGGPHMRHLIVPAFESGTNTVGNKYWKNNWRVHQLSDNSNATLEKRWDDDYFKITVGGENWNSNVDSGAKNSGTTFGIWNEASWLIDMFLRGKVAIFSNAAGTRERDHNGGLVMLQNGFIDTPNSKVRYSGWGGRLAQETGGRAISLTNLPNPFCYGQGPSGERDDVVVDEFISMHSSRNFGLYGDDSVARAQNLRQTMASSISRYYEALRAGEGATEQNNSVGLSQKFTSQENKIRQFSGSVNEFLGNYREPDLIRALYSNRDTDNQLHSFNLSADGTSRRIIRLSGFGQQIRNLNDAIRCHSLLDTRVASMTILGWDTHSQQRQFGNREDPNDVEASRGIETQFKDMFSHGNSSLFPSHVHGGFSALWETLSPADKDNIVISLAGEFGRQIRDNSDNGTDHGEGNYIFLISEKLNGGLYGDLFPSSEIDLLDDTSVRTPAIKPETDIDHIFGSACDWVKGSPSNVFSNRANAELEQGVDVSNLFQA